MVLFSDSFCVLNSRPVGNFRTTTRTLHLVCAPDNSIADDGLFALIPAFKKLKALQKLDIAGQSTHAIYEFMPRTLNATSCWLTDNYISESGLRKLGRLFSKSVALYTESKRTNIHISFYVVMYVCIRARVCIAIGSRWHMVVLRPISHPHASNCHLQMAAPSPDFSYPHSYSHPDP